MKRNDFIEIKNLDPKALIEKVRVLREELADLRLDKGINKLTDVKIIVKKRKDLAKVLTVLNQKRLLEKLEAQVKKTEPSSKSPEVSDDEKSKKEKVKKIGKKGRTK